MVQVQEKAEQMLCSLYDSLVHMFVKRLRVKCPDLVTSAHSVTKASYVPSSSRLWMDNPRVSATDLSDYLL